MTTKAELTNWLAQIDRWIGAARTGADEVAAAGITFNRMVTAPSLDAVMAEAQLPEDDQAELYAALYDAHDAFHEACVALQDARDTLNKLKP